MLHLPRLYPAIFFLAASSLFSQQLPGENDRLIAIAKLWVTVHYFHPYLAYREIDWDKALVDALPKIRAAGSKSEYASSIQSMLDALKDPLTYVSEESLAQTKADSLKFEMQPDGTLVVSAADKADVDINATQRLAAALKTANKVIFDLRLSGASLSSLLDEQSIQAMLIASPLDLPGQRTWVHNGLAPGAESPGDYHSAFYVKPGLRITATSGGPGLRFVFLVGENAPVPVVACALANTGRAAVIPMSAHYRIAGTDTAVISLGAGLEAIVRLSESVFLQGAGLPEFRAVSPDQAFTTAVEWFANPFPNLSRKFLPPYPTPVPDRAYDETPYPSAEYRILAAYKIWGTVRYFFAYKDLMDEDWDDIFASFLPKFLAAKNAQEFNLTIAEMISHIADSGAGIQSKALADFFGAAPVGLRLRLIDKKPVITEILDEDAKKAGVQVGDIVAKVDGENIVPRVNRLARYISSSTQQWLGYRIMNSVLNGPEGATAGLTILDRNSQSKQVTLRRSIRFMSAFRFERQGDVIKLLSGNIGYADLNRLTPEQVNDMFTKFSDAKAIIFDMRGTSRGAALSIAPRLTDEKDVPAAIITGPLALAPDLAQTNVSTQTASYFFVQNLPQTAQWKYKGKTVMLTDERTIGQGEHAGLMFEVANKTEFIGSASAGADSDLTSFVVPGGVTISFSGHDIRHANGGKLQRLGLQPSITVSPTIAGIRSGRDEVLEKAVEYLSGENSRRAANFGTQSRTAKISLTAARNGTIN